VEFSIRRVRFLVAPDKASSVDRLPAIGVDPAKLLTFSDFRVRHVAYASNKTNTVIGAVTNNGNATLSRAPFAAAVTCALYSKGKPIASAFDHLPVLPPATPVAFLAIILPNLPVDDIQCSPDWVRASAVASPSELASIAVGPPSMGTAGQGSIYVVSAATVTNTSAMVALDVQPAFDVADAGGRLIGNLQAEALPYLLPGQQSFVGGHIIGDWLDGAPASVTTRTAIEPLISPAAFAKQYGYDPAGPPSITVTNVRLDPTSTYFAKVLATLTNSTSKSYSVWMECAVFRNGTPFATTWKPGVSVPANGTAEFDQNFSELTPADAAGGELRCTAFPRAV
jgi:hypothetical protein